MNNKEEMLLLLRKMGKKINSMEKTIKYIKNEHGAMLQALVDGQVITEEKLAVHKQRLVKLETKTNNHNVKIAHLLKKAK